MIILKYMEEFDMKLIETLLEIWECVKDDPVIVSALIVGFCGIITITITMIIVVLKAC